MKCKECGSSMLKLGVFNTHNKNNEVIEDIYWVCKHGCAISIERNIYGKVDHELKIDDNDSSVDYTIKNEIRFR